MFASKSRPERQSLAVERGERRRESRCRSRWNVPSRSQYVADAERHPGAFTVDDEAGRDALDASGRRAGADAAERDVRDLVADEAVEHAATLLRLDQLHVEIAPVVDRLGDRLARDLVEHHPLDRHVRLEHLEEVPRDRLALAVLVGREVELARVLQRGLELGHDVLLVGGHDVDRARSGRRRRCRAGGPPAW